MSFLKSRDVEDALRKDIGSILTGSTVIAPPIPDTLGNSLPLVVVYRLGGGRSDIVIEEHDISIDVYAKRWSLAQDAANVIAAVLVELPDLTGLVSGVDWLDAGINALPYNNPDPRHEDIPRVTFSATVTCRPEAINL